MPSATAVVLCLVLAASSAEELLTGLERCGSEVGTCLRVRALGLLERALRTGPLRLNDYLTLTPEGPLEGLKQGRALTEEDILAGLPKEEDAREAALDGMIADRMTDFISSRSLKINMPTELGEGRRKSGGGGGGKKGGGMMMMAALAMGGMMVQMAMAKIALLAGKALLIGKMALLLSAIIGLKKLLGGGGGESHQVVYATESHGGGGHGWGRSSDPAAHELAYSAQSRNNQQN